MFIINIFLSIWIEWWFIFGCCCNFLEFKQCWNLPCHTHVWYQHGLSEKWTRFWCVEEEPWYRIWIKDSRGWSRMIKDSRSPARPSARPDTQSISSDTQSISSDTQSLNSDIHSISPDIQSINSKFKSWNIMTIFPVFPGSKLNQKGLCSSIPKFKTESKWMISTISRFKTESKWLVFQYFRNPEFPTYFYIKSGYVQ